MEYARLDLEGVLFDVKIAFFLVLQLYTSPESNQYLQ